MEEDEEEKEAKEKDNLPFFHFLSLAFFSFSFFFLLLLFLFIYYSAKSCAVCHQIWAESLANQINQNSYRPQLTNTPSKHKEQSEISGKRVKTGIHT